MMGSDFGNTIVGGEGQTTARKKSKLLAKYKVGGKVTDKKALVAEALKHKRARLREKYAEGGAVGNTQSTYQPQTATQANAKPIQMPYRGGSWWQQLQQEIANLTPQSPLGSMNMNQNGMTSSAQMPQAQAAAQQNQPQAQPSSPTGMARGGRVR